MNNKTTILAKIKKETSVMLIVSIVSIALIAGAGIWYIRENVNTVSEELGTSAAHDSKSALETQTKEALQRLVKNKAEISDEKFNAVIDSVNMMRESASKIMSNPDKYAPREILFPNAANEGILVSQLRLAKNVSADDLAAEIALISNIEDILFLVKTADENIESAYLGTQDGISISVDTSSHLKENVFDPRDRPWYSAALEKDDIIWTDVFNDATGRGLAITFAAPYHDAENRAAGVVGAGMKLTVLNDIVVGTKIGETGYAFMLNEQGQMIISDRIERDEKNNIIRENLLENPDLSFVAKKMINGETGIERIVIDGTEKFIAFCPLEALPWSLATVMDVEEAILPAINSENNIINMTDKASGRIDSIIITLALLFAIAFLLQTLFMRKLSEKLAKTLSDPIIELGKGAAIIGSGDLNHTLSIHTGDELELLADTFNSMITSIKSITKEKERIGAELDVATKIQASMLPCIFPAFPGRAEFDIFALMHPAKEVGGDFYDFFLIDEDNLGIVMADVSGKGVPAALFMVIAKTLIKNQAQNKYPPGKVLEIVNNQLCETNDAGMFVTTFFGILTISTGEFTYSNAGHNPPAIYRKGEGFKWLETKPGFVLAGMEDMKFVVQSVMLEKGNLIFMYTDGVTEAVNPKNELYTEARLLNTLNALDLPKLNISGITDKVNKSIIDFANGAEQADDITMLFLEIK